MAEPTQLSLPVYGSGDNETRTKMLKTAIGGTITDPRDQPGRPLHPYEPIFGLFYGTVVHAGGDATYIGEERAPTHSQKITASQVFVPLTEDSKRLLRDVFARILEENRKAALQIGILDEDAESKAS